MALAVVAMAEEGMVVEGTPTTGAVKHTPLHLGWPKSMLRRFNPIISPNPMVTPAPAKFMLTRRASRILK
jgi:hypothetical protein